MVSKKYCSHAGCKRLVKLNERYCDKHKPKDSHVSKTSMYANEIHSSNRWRRTSRLYREAHPICEACLRASKEGDQSREKRAGMINLATSVDHIKPLFAGGEPYDWDNLQSLCDYHHSLKSQREREQKNKPHRLYLKPEQYRGAMQNSSSMSAILLKIKFPDF